MVIVFFLAQAITLAILSWQTVQNNTDLKLAQQQNAVLSFEKYVTHKISEDIRLLEQEIQAQKSLEEIVQTHSRFKVIYQIPNINTLPPELPDDIKRAFRNHINSQQTVSLLGNREALITLNSAGGNLWVAIVSIKDWIPMPSSGNLIALLSDNMAEYIGNIQMSNILYERITNTPQIIKIPSLGQVLSACSNINTFDLRLCIANKHHWFTPKQISNFLIYILLLSAPVLMIFGLIAVLKRSIRRSEELENEKNVLKEHFESAAYYARSGVWEYNIDTDTATITHDFAKTLNIARLNAMSITDFIQLAVIEDRERLQYALNNALNSGELNIVVRTSLQPLRWLELRGCLVKNQTSICLKGMMYDISEHKLRAYHILQSERQTRAALEGITAPFAHWDNRKRLIYHNQAFVREFNIADNILQSNIPYDVVMREIKKFIEVDKFLEMERASRECHLRNGKWIRLTERQTLDGGMITYGIDITSLKQHEEQWRDNEKKLRKLVLKLERSQGHANEMARKYAEEKSKAEHAAQTKSAFLANMSHELRTPLNAINGFSEILAKELFGPLGDERYKEYSHDILESGQHLLDMINDILDMAKIEAGKMSIAPRPINPIEPIDAAIRMMRRKAKDKQLHLSLEANDLPEIEADHRAIKQMVLNLTANAIKFTDTGGSVSVRAVKRKKDILVCVTDTGVGIPEQDIPRLAQPFEQVQNERDRNYNGTGLGLALTKSFAEMHGGQFFIESELGKGTTVSFTLPFTEADITPTDSLDKFDEVFAPNISGQENNKDEIIQSVETAMGLAEQALPTEDIEEVAVELAK